VLVAFVNIEMSPFTCPPIELVCGEADAKIEARMMINILNRVTFTALVQARPE
jgi:hypothetical protein